MTAHSDNTRLPVICILGAWSSGSTAVTGYIARAGAHSCPPHVQTNDPRTPDSHESVDFALRLRAVFHENTLKQIGDRAAFSSWFGDWLSIRSQEARAAGASHLVLKHPLAVFLIKEISADCNPQYLVVTRPFHKIEETRLRRKWAPNYGAAGAQKLYSTGFSGLIAAQASFETIAFHDFLQSQHRRQSVLHNLGLAPDSAQIDNAEKWLK